MNDFIDKEYKIFDLFHNQWALVTAGTIDHYNACTIGWGSLGTLWTRPDSDGSVVTVYVHPGRYTLKFLQENDTFTVSFFPKEYRKALGYMGSHSGRDGDKAAAAGLTPIEMDGSVTFAEASTTMVCRKIYAHSFVKEGLAADIQEYYKSRPQSFPVNQEGEWEPHWEIIGEIMRIEES